MKEEIIIVDKNDVVIGAKDRATCTSDDIYRVSALWIFNSHGDVLLAQRALTKRNDPGKWGPAVAGTVEVNETYDSNIIKEAEEELGITNIKPVFLERVFAEHYKHPHFTARYGAVIDREVIEFTIQKDEVAQIKWFTQNELKSKLQADPGSFIKSVADWERIFKLLQ